MTAWVKPSPSFQDNTPITAAPHNANWDSISNYVNGLATGTNLDAGVINSGKLAELAVTESKIAGQAVTEDKIASAVLSMMAPIGSIVPFVGSTEPTGWYFCNGQIVSNLASLGNGTLYGYLGNSTTLPDLRDRFPIGASATKVLKSTGGSATITTGQLPSHAHANAPVLTNGTLSITSTDSGHTHTGTTNNDGNHSHNTSVKRGTSSMAHDGTTTFSAGGSPNVGEITIATGSLASHQHNFTTNSGTATITSTGTVGTAITANNASTGNGEAYWQPYYAVNYIIRAY